MPVCGLLVGVSRVQDSGWNIVSVRCRRSIVLSGSRYTGASYIISMGCLLRHVASVYPISLVSVKRTEHDLHPCACICLHVHVRVSCILRLVSCVAVCPCRSVLGVLQACRVGACLPAGRLCLQHDR
jgi:hypothetical protein